MKKNDIINSEGPQKKIRSLNFWKNKYITVLEKYVLVLETELAAFSKMASKYLQRKTKNKGSRSIQNSGDSDGVYLN